jgi:hypothetical protein
MLRGGGYNHNGFNSGRGNGGRSSYGRSSFNGRGFNRGGGRFTQDVGATTPTLNFSVGQKASPATVTKWLMQMRDVIGEKCSKSGMKNIIQEDGTIVGYEEFDDLPPPDPDDVIEMTIWKTRLGINERKRDDYETDKMVAANAVLMYIGLQSRARLYEANESFPEDERWNLNDIRDLLNLVMHTHFADMRSDRYTVSEDANRSFVNIHMNPEEDLLNYNYRWKVLQDAYVRALVQNGLENEEISIRLGSQEELVKRFIRGLDDGRYAIHKEKYLCGDKPWPDQLEDAYKQANQFLSSKLNQNKRGIFIMSHARSNSARSNSGCNRCGSSYHGTEVCKNVLPSRGGRGRKDGRYGGRGRGRDQVSDRKGDNAADKSSDKQAGGGPGPKL